MHLFPFHLVMVAGAVGDGIQPHDLNGPKPYEIGIEWRAWNNIPRVLFLRFIHFSLCTYHRFRLRLLCCICIIHNS